MPRVDRIDHALFLGREFLLWLWFESELFGATLQTAEHGTFGLWLEQRLVLSGEQENTSLTAPLPGIGREAKEALLRGQLPDSAGVRVTLGRIELSFVLKADLAISALKSALIPDTDEAGAAPAPEARRASGAGSRTGKSGADTLRRKFEERMRAARELDPLLEALYRDFLAMRLSPAWREVVVPLLTYWAEGQELELDAYETLRDRSPRTVSEIVDLTPAEAEELVVLVDDADADEAEPAKFVSAQ